MTIASYSGDLSAEDYSRAYQEGAADAAIERDRANGRLFAMSTRVDKLERELAAAQAEVEKLRADRDYWKAVYQEITAFYWGRPVA